MVILDELGLFKEEDVKTDVVVINIGESTKLEALKMASYLRNNGVKCEIDYNSSSLKAQFKLCERKKAKKIIIIGEDEISNGIFKLKDKERDIEEELKIEELNVLFNIEGEKYAYKK